MSGPMIPDAELIETADVVTVWVASPPAPKDVWSLAEAIAWIIAHPDAARITLFRPPGGSLPAAWVRPEQISRIAEALGAQSAA